ncbi:MAG: hypothetical protein V4653_02275 [Pseudomonadota bacterium]
MAMGGGLVGVVGVLGALRGEGPVPSHVLGIFAGWCVVTPYWWYAEHRWLAPTDPAARAEFERRQAYSRQVWLGFALAMGVLILARAR